MGGREVVRSPKKQLMGYWLRVTDHDKAVIATNWFGSTNLQVVSI